jgi:hypothetical protein
LLIYCSLFNENVNISGWVASDGAMVGKGNLDKLGKVVLVAYYPGI